MQGLKGGTFEESEVGKDHRERKRDREGDREGVQEVAEGFKGSIQPAGLSDAFRAHNERGLYCIMGVLGMSS